MNIKIGSPCFKLAIKQYAELSECEIIRVSKTGQRMHEHGSEPTKFVNILQGHRITYIDHQALKVCLVPKSSAEKNFVGDSTALKKQSYENILILMLHCTSNS